MAHGGAGDRLLARVWAELGRDPGELRALAPLPAVPLPARLDVSSLAVATVAAASLAGWAHEAGPGSLHLDGARIATAFTSERVVEFDGRAPDVWAPLSGFRRARDGWVRTHGNYPHHAEALRRVLGLSEADAAAPAIADAAVASWEADDLAKAVTAAGGMCVAVAPEVRAVDAALAETPLIEVTARADGTAPPSAVHRRDGLPLAGVRVLDLTRVIAGPVATRTLALLGADVLRVDPPSPPEIGWQHLDTGPGKRSAILDLTTADDAARFDELLGSAEAIVLGYRPSALRRLGLEPAAILERFPGLVVAQLSAWGVDGRAGERGGFDSLVQAASGIAIVEGGSDAPGALPAQALDHATGYLLAAAITTLVERRRAEGGSWLARMSLRRTAAELLTMPRRADPSPPGIGDVERAGNTTTLSGPAGSQRIPLPAIASPDGPMTWRQAPHQWGSDIAGWAD
ncbi:crotonobetainyl-CoA:carnitine CoA-transferase CaiB-like acyl-CoA transferase [Agromyces flavus]|uniref:CoA-transferase family III n=1 Tax=Agromyces flavus TaxID=589382 RepID=A0A1H1STD9_9MICO|nr:CoA transferase [Agromyces flavus]MCP2369300.1 crotonobetainyl-CoA:carnitine CoA-transferase CaiB-like acyl-CoA transferase [Agromyces flavus]GGI48726.1 putative L-carnitine dehydratase [Agromyces flavus]SDS51242.1 CoA-transferase family III [Agromyces flavus]